MDENKYPVLIKNLQYKNNDKVDKDIYIHQTI